MQKEGWTEYLMGLAVAASKKSKDSTKVGAVLVGPQKEVRLTAFNGPPRGVVDSEERRKRPAKYLYSSHAEQNLVAFAARCGISTNGCAVVVTHMPCDMCAKSLIQAGITKVVVGEGETHMPLESFQASKTMFEEAGVIVCHEV